MKLFNCLRAIWPKGYQRGSLGKSHQNGDYLEQREKVILIQDSNLQPLEYRSTAPTLELERMSPRMLNSSYLNPVTCFYYDVDNNLIMMF